MASTTIPAPNRYPVKQEKVMEMFINLVLAFLAAAVLFGLGVAWWICVLLLVVVLAVAYTNMRSKAHNADRGREGDRSHRRVNGEVDDYEQGVEGGE